MSTYYTFRISRCDVSLILHHSFYEQEAHKLAMLSSSSPSERKVKTLFRKGIDKLRTILNTEDLSDQIIAMDSTQEQLEWCRESLREISGAVRSKYYFL